MTKGTALGEARERFVESLPDRARELRGALALVTAAPGADRPREELLRRLRSLHSSSQVFRLSMLAEALRERIEVLDLADAEKREVGDEDLESMTNLIAVMPTLGQRTESQVGPLPTGPSSPSLPAPSRRRKDTAKGFPVLSLDTPTPFPPPDVPRGVMALLVVDSAASVAQIKKAVAPARCEVLWAETSDEAIRIAKRRAPDVILLGREEASRSGNELVARLRSERLTATTPIAVVHERGDAMAERALLELGADVQIERSDTVLAQRIAVLGTVSRRPPSLERIGDTTLEELAERLANELHRGIVDAASRGERLSVGDGSELLAAAWTAVEEVRARISEHTQGRIRYREAGGPLFLSMESSAGNIASPLAEEESALSGRRLVVADDDPAIVWFFASLLREAGAEVFEAQDGEEALGLIREHHPDAVISDIVMPKCDGLELCRALADDPAFAELPIVLISWKDDFLERMKELQSGAKGYLRKEAESHVILSRIEEVLGPRIHLDESLTEADADADEAKEIGGRVEGLGVYPILRSVARAKPDSRLVVRASHNLFEANVRGGQVIDVTRTADDGSFRRGPSALLQMLGVAHGRYVLHAVAGRPARTSVRDGDDALDMAAMTLRSVTRVLGTTRLNAVEVVRFDDEFIGPFLSELPADVATGIRRIRSGVAPRVVAGDTDGVREALVDLGKRGAVSELRGPGGEDLVAAARAELESIDERRKEDAASAYARTESSPALPQVDDDGDDDSDDADEPEVEVAEETGDTSPPLSPLYSDHPDDDDPEDDEEMDAISLAAWKAALEDDDDDDDDDDGEVAQWDQDSDTTPGSRLRRENALRERLASSVPPPARPQKGQPPGLWFLVLGLLFAIGAGTCWATRRGESPDNPADIAPGEGVTEDNAEAPPVEPASEPPVEAPPERVGSPSELAFGTEGTLPPGTRIGASEGLLVIQDNAEDVTVRLGGDPPRFLGSPPLQVPLEEGSYEVSFESPSSSHVRFVYVRAGQSRIVSPPGE